MCARKFSKNFRVHAPENLSIVFPIVFFFSGVPENLSIVFRIKIYGCHAPENFRVHLRTHAEKCTDALVDARSDALVDARSDACSDALVGRTLGRACGTRMWKHSGTPSRMDALVDVFGATCGVVRFSYFVQKLFLGQHILIFSESMKITAFVEI